MSVKKNIVYGLEIKKISDYDISDYSQEEIEQLFEDMANKPPLEEEIYASSTIVQENKVQITEPSQPSSDKPSPPDSVKPSPIINVS